MGIEISKHISKIAKHAFQALLFWGLTTIVMLIDMFPHHPKSPVGWILLFVFSAPILVVGELTADFMLRENRIARNLEDETASQSLSVARILYALFALLTWLAILWGCYHFLNLGTFFDLLSD
jgi:hypothetical protein